MPKSKSYTEELAEWVGKREVKKPRQDSAAVAFLAVKPDIQEAISAGYALTTIWEHMHETGKLQCGYETFRKHVQRRIKKIAPEANRETDNLKAGPVSVARAAIKKPTPPAKPSGFKFNSSPNKEELL